MFQRAGRKTAAALNPDKVSLMSLVTFCDKAREDLERAGDEDSALRFELLAEYLRNDFRGGSLIYNSRILGL